MPTHATLDGDGKVPASQLPASSGGGDVNKVGTPVNNQLGVWTGDGTIEGTTALTYDGTNLRVAANIIDLEDVTFKTGALGGTLRTGTSGADKFELQAYDTNDGIYRKVLEVDAGTAPRLEVFADSFAIWDNVDESKQCFFTLSGGTNNSQTEFILSPTADRVITFPDASGTLSLTSHDHSGTYQPLATVLTNTTAAFTTAQETKLSGIETGAQVNVATDLSYTAATRVLASSTGTDATLPLVTTGDAGLAPASGGGTTNFLRADGTWAAPGGGSATDLSYTAATRVLASSTGADATLPLVSTGDAGLAPASGGGTSNFLRADGTWTAPTVGYHFVGTLAGDQATGANVTPVTLTGLVFSYAANSKYRIWAMGNVSPTAATTGCGFQFDLSSAVTSIGVIFTHQLANTGTQSGGHSIADDASVGVSSGMPGTSTYPVILDGILITGANTGTAQLRFRSETTAVTTCKAGFTLVVEKIA